MITPLMKFLSLILLLVLVCLVFFNNVDCKKQSKKKKKASKDENVATFSSREQLSKHMKDMTEKEKQGGLDETPSEEELLELRKEEIRIRLSEDEIVEKHGKLSKEYGKYLHKLGRTIYKQQRYDELLEMSREIVKIHETLDGPEHENTARALGNVGSVAYRLKKLDECNIAMERAMYIWVQKYGETSKEVLLHRGKMLTFHLPNAETTLGMSYAEVTGDQDL